MSPEFAYLTQETVNTFLSIIVGATAVCLFTMVGLYISDCRRRHRK